MPFWFAGTFVSFRLRPKDVRRRLAIALFYVYAIWVVVGQLSFWHVWGASLALHILSWLLIPVSVHLHLIVTHYFRAQFLLRLLLVFLYLSAISLSILDAIRWLPRGAFTFGFIFQLVIILLLLFSRLVTNKAHMAARMMFFGITLVFVPGISAILISEFVNKSQQFSYVIFNGIFLVAFMTWPLFYIYGMYQPYLGRWEYKLYQLLKNISFSGLCIIISAIALSLLWLFTDIFSYDQLTVTTLCTIVSVLGAVWLYRRFDLWMNVLAYGRHPSSLNDIDQIIEQTSTSSNPDLPALLGTIVDKVAYHLDIKQIALYLTTGGRWQQMFARGANPPTTIPVTMQKRLQVKSGYYLPPNEGVQELAWARLILPLSIGDNVIGIWLLGTRDITTSNFYPWFEVLHLDHIADQMARLIQVQQQIILAMQHDKMNALTRLGLALAHETNNKIQSIQAGLQFALQSDNIDSEHITNWLQTAYDSSLYLHYLFNRLLNFSREPVLSVPMHLERMLELAIDSNHTLINANKVNLIVDIADDVPAIYGSNHLVLVFSNQIVNACEAMVTSGGILTIQARVENSFLCISFVDTGVGIQLKELPKIFEAYYTTKDEAHDVGLGLTISYHTINWLGGEITVDSQVGRGATFLIRLPMKWPFLNNNPL